MKKGSETIAVALLGLCDQREKVLELGKIWNTSQELRIALADPEVSLSGKYAVISRIAEKAEIPDILIRFCKYLCREQKINLLPDIISRYDVLWHKQRGELDVRLIFARNPGEEEKKQADRQLHRLFPGCTFSVRTVIDPSLLGGFIIQADGKEYDRSYDGMMKALERAVVG